MSTVDAATLLTAAIKSPIQQETLFAIEPEDVDAIVRLLEWTRAAIVIRWLRILEGQTKSVTMWTDVLIEVEEQLFPADPLKGMGSVALVNKLLPLLAEHWRVSTDKSISEAESFSRMRIWTQSWISLICPDAAYVEKLGRIFVFHLQAFMADEIIGLTDLINQLSAKLSGKE